MEKLKTASGAFCFASCKKRVFAFLFFKAISLPCIFSNCLKREIPLCSFSFLSIYYYRKDFSFDSHIYVPLLAYSCSIIIGHNVYSTVTIHFHSIYIYIQCLQYCYYTFPFLILPPPPSLLRLYKFQRTKVVFKL
jgi:hypothetical protein